MIYKRNIIQTEAALLVQYYQPLLANRHKKPPGRQLMTRERFSPIQSNFYKQGGPQGPQRASGDI